MTTGKVFWSLIDAWNVRDSQALELIGYPGKLGRNSKRPRFRLTARQTKVLGFLLENDEAFRAAVKTRPNERQPPAARLPGRNRP
jgi:hypothetical protein